MTRPVFATRLYLPEDRATCLTLFASNAPTFFSPLERPDFESFLDDLPGPYLLLLSGTEVAGCGGYAYRDEGTVADLCWGMIRSDLHGIGLGTVLATRRIELALADSRVEELRLKTTQNTFEFYERFGFRLESITEDGFAPGFDLYEMRRYV